MTTETETPDVYGAPGSADWMRRLVQRYASGEGGNRDDSQLLSAAEHYRLGSMAGSDLQHYKGGSLAYIRTFLAERPQHEQDAFLLFLVQSELVNESIEVRTALYEVVEPHLKSALSRFDIEVASALLRSRKPPFDSLAARMAEPVRAAHRKSPSWLYVGLLASMVGHSRHRQYSEDDLVEDIARLAEQPSFESALMKRNALWMSMSPPLDGISILTRIRRNQSNYPQPSNFTPSMQGLRKAIVAN